MARSGSAGGGGDKAVRFFFPEVEEMPVPPGHRFPAIKYRLLREAVEREAILSPEWLAPSPAADIDDLQRAHAPSYVAAVLDGTLAPDIVRRIGLPWSPALARRSRLTVGGSLAAARAALHDGLSGQLAGGTHHAHRDFGSGFCVFNDLAVSALTLLEQGEAHRIAILDLDVHQGDGNSAILVGRPGMMVASIQGERNFPFRRVPSDLDVELPDGTGDEVYLTALIDVLDAVAAHRPELVLYLSGVDPLKEDRLGRLALTHAGLAERDRMVFEMCRRRGFAVSIAIGGGYAVPIEASVAAYANTFRVARDVFGP
ncbi:MAG: histone deacetylase [Hyphomicrobiaceae bacterium]